MYTYRFGIYGRRSGGLLSAKQAHARNIRCLPFSFFGHILACAVLGFAVRANAQWPDRTVLPVTEPPFQGKIQETIADSVAEKRPVISAPTGAPNVLVILLDDAGYGEAGTFGGLIPTPTLDSLATGGLRYTRFHVAAMCSPTRASLLTGRNHHAVGMGTIANSSSDYPGYTSSIPKSAAMISSVLQQNGYATAAIGKWHLIPPRETSFVGPFDHWPTRQGFDYYYGFIGAEVDQWYPELVEGIKPVEMVAPPGRKGDYTLSENLADNAIRWIQMESSLEPNKPFFMYFASGATHAPLQVPKEYIDKFKGKFDMGWDRYRELVLERQKSLGIVPKDTQLTARPAEIPAWDSLTPQQKQVDARLMEVFAGYMTQVDHEVGRVVDAIRAAGRLDNTLIIYIAGDNGASLEGGPAGTINTMAQINGVPESTEYMFSHLNELGGPKTTPHYPAGWAWAGDTPFQWGKRIGSHLGGTRDPLVISWPARIKDQGGIRTQFHDVTDVFPTILEAAGIPAPTSVYGVKQQRVDGVSMMYTFDSPAASDKRTTQYFEMLGNRAIYNDGWMAAKRTGVPPWDYGGQAKASAAPPWELYNLQTDFSEARDVARDNPQKLKDLQNLFELQARENQVFPLNDRFGGGGVGSKRPTEHLAYYPGTSHLWTSLSPHFENRSFTITAAVDLSSRPANGVLLATGGEAGGFSLYLKNGIPSFTYNYFKRQVVNVSASKPLTAGPAKIVLQFDYEGSGPGNGATATLLVNGTVAGKAHIDRTAVSSFSFEETFDIGEDSASPVGSYDSPFPFDAKLERVDLDLAAQK